MVIFKALKVEFGTVWDARIKVLWMFYADSYLSCVRVVANAPRQRIGVISRCWLLAPEGVTQRLHVDRNGLVPSSAGAQSWAICDSAQVLVLVCFRESVFVRVAGLRGWGKDAAAQAW